MANVWPQWEEQSSKAAFFEEEKLSLYSEKVESQFESVRKEYSARLPKNIRHRFRKEDSEVFKYFGILLDPSMVAESSENEIKDALELFRVEWHSCYGLSSVMSPIKPV